MRSLLTERLPSTMLLRGSGIDFGSGFKVRVRSKVRVRVAG